MRAIRVLCVSLFAGLLLLSAPQRATAGDAKFINLALWDTVQLFSSDTAIHGVRLNIYGKNQEMKGVDLEFVHRITGEGVGLQLGLANWTEGEFTGWQSAFVNYNTGTATGVMIGSVNYGGTAKGVQWGLVNYTESASGLQVAFFNYTEHMEKGLQIGLINVIKSKDKLPIFPIVNWVF